MTRFATIVMASIAVFGIGSPALLHPAPRLIWNASASVPIGLYAVHPAGAPQVGELVVVTPPDPLADFLDERTTCRGGVPLLKRILAIAGQTVCRTGRAITVDGDAMGEALDRDHLGRPLPVWQGCHRVADGEAFLMNRQPADSLDGRYFGALPAAAIVGRAEPLWTLTEP
ncbi:MAG: S26 family signal peptidase [Aliidongia sp.]